MKENPDNKTKPDAYEDFLSEISTQQSAGAEEKEFIENLEPAPQEEDIEANVGVRVKKVRETRGLSLEDIALRTDIGTSTLKRIEKGDLTPPLGMIIRLAKALEMKMGYFISGEQNQPYTIVRKSDRKVVSRYDSKKGEHYGYHFESLAPHKKDRHIDPFLVTLIPAETEEERSTHDGQEFIFVLQGTMEVRLGEEIHILEPSDSIYYDSTVPHLVKCHGDQETKILAVLYSEK
jgi:transcriptional regulator with XRE-family HTH domain